ncbi:MAG TPA: Ig-like domain-containing protein [Candidatus Krumholzibacteria bacterium]|nr:Ig-like domain-containing protein [Candidatus Krumholzibacteria bacterium]HPD71582.1 Ig-like domain-containing protein [Candidatus Krumholzibacteria bacterium]HRY41485.1 Ig-like domain-containing protein [Candidatus Krumholzibacteria bacterium]
MPLRRRDRSARDVAGGTWLARLVLSAWAAQLGSCASPEAPPGGPVDEVPPSLVSAVPESATTGHGPLRELRFGFSEKMDRTDAYRWLNVYPRRTVRGTSWRGSTTAVVEFDEPLPADTVVVVEILPGMKDSHGVPQPAGRSWVFATGDSIPTGEITGRLVLEKEPAAGAVVELLPDGPDTVRLAQRPVLRRAVADSGGTFRLSWLPADGDGWLLRAYDDRNRDRRAGDAEAQRLWPDTLRLAATSPRLDAGLRLFYLPTSPGTLTGRLSGRPPAEGPVLAFLRGIAEGDSGFVPAPQPPGASPARAVPDTGDFELPGAGPGLVRAVFFVDRDGDSLLSAVGEPADTLWALEPWALADSVPVEPGLPARLPLIVWPDTLTPWAAPPPDTAAALPDTAAASPDSLARPPEE